jgi:hypothetical protein
MSSSSNGGKVSFFITFQYNSKRLTNVMMVNIGFNVDEIVTTRDTAVQYSYVHLKRKAREEDLNRAIQSLESVGVKGSELFGYNTIASDAPSALEHIEDHPGFQTLVDHETQRNSEFFRWTANGYNQDANCGYNLLKGRLLVKASAFQGSSFNSVNYPSVGSSGARPGSGNIGTGELVSNSFYLLKFITNFSECANRKQSCE